MTLTKSDFEKYRANEVLARTDGHYGAFSYLSICGDEAKRHEDAGDETGAALFRLFACLTSPYLDFANLKDPLKPLSEWDGGRSPIPDDFSDEQLIFIAEIAQDVLDPNMRARIADVLWLRKRDHSFACLAHQSYLESVDLDNLVHYMSEHVIRAMQIATLLNNADLLKRSKYLAQRIADKELESGEIPSWHFMTVGLAQYDKPNREEYADQLWNKATEVELTGDLGFAIRLRERAIEIYKESKNPDRVREAQLELVEILARYAADDAKNGDYWSAHHKIEDSIKWLNQANGNRERLEELRLILHEYGRKSNENMDWQQIFTEVSGEELENLNKLTRSVIESLKGKTLEEALQTLAYFPHQVGHQWAKEHVEKFKNESIAYRIASFRTINDAGKVISRDMVLATTSHYAAGLRQIIFGSVIGPAILQITTEHTIDSAALTQIFEKTDFIPKYHLKTFTHAMLAGFKFEFVSVAHILPPLIENALRTVLSSMGIATSYFKNQLIEREQYLGWVLRHSAIKQILGENLQFDLKTLLVHDDEDQGLNLRNDMSHGLLTDDAYFQAGEGYNLYHIHIIYLWWLALKLSFLVKKTERHE